MSTPDDLTVVVPARDAASTIESTLRSILDQNAGAPHVIVVDDGSTDGTGSIAVSISERVRVVVGPQRGPGAARNAGVAEAHTPFLAFCDADDRWVLDRVGRDLDRLDDDADVDLLLGLSRFETDEPELLAGHHFDTDEQIALIPHFGAATLRRHVFDTIGPIDEELRNYEDYEWFYRARDLGVAVVSHDRVVQTRWIHGGSMSHQTAPEPRDLLAVIRRSVDRRRRGSRIPPHVARLSDLDGLTGD